MMVHAFNLPVLSVVVDTPFGRSSEFRLVMNCARRTMKPRLVIVSTIHYVGELLQALSSGMSTSALIIPTKSSTICAQLL